MGKKAPIGMCRLCRQVQPLRRSHVLPEFCYKPLYGPDHRTKKYVEGQSGFETVQKGFREYLLCEAGEQHLNRNYEQPYSRQFRAHVGPWRLDEGRIRSCDKVPAYPIWRLFHLSVLWRVVISQRAEYADVTLPSEVEGRLRDMLWAGDAGEYHVYPFISIAIVDQHGAPITAFISKPRTSQLACPVVSMCYLGFEWIFFLTTCLIPEIDKVFDLIRKPSDPFLFAVQRLEESDPVQDAARLLNRALASDVVPGAT